MVTDSGFLEAVIYHKRHAPAEHSFAYKVFFLTLNLKDIKFLSERNLFSVNKFNLFSLFWTDYGFEKFHNPLEYIEKTLKNLGVNPKYVADVVLMTLPRILGYAFNPVSFWLCFNKNGGLVSVLAEVNNTFSERHGYLCFHDTLELIKSTDVIQKEKVFHVSPFCHVTGQYDFRFHVDAKKITIDINYKQDNNLIISTSIRGKRVIFTNKTLLKYLFAYPFMTLKIILLIHYHALRLWIKKVPYFKKPQKPPTNIS